MREVAGGVSVLKTREKPGFTPIMAGDDRMGC
jgi:hypothetical protein